MSEQQYRVIADATMKDLRTDDLAVVRVAEGFEDGAWSAEPGLVRIERPVPTTDEPDDHYYRAVRISDGLVAGPWGRGERAQITADTEWREETSSEAGWVAVEHRSVPTREQIAEAIAGAVDGTTEEAWQKASADYRGEMLDGADAVLALLDGADR